MDALPPGIKASGLYQGATPSCPAFWTLNEGGCRLALSIDVLRLPNDPALSMLLDIWLDACGKVLSVSWFPTQRWVLPMISALKAGGTGCIALAGDES